MWHSTACLPDRMQIEIYGKTMGPAQADYDAVRKAIEELVSDVQLKKFVLQATGIEGGFTVYLVPNGQQGKSAMMQKMTSLQVDRSETTYSFKFVEHFLGLIEFDSTGARRYRTGS